MTQKVVYGARDVAEATIVVTLLRDAGIRSVMGNISLQGGIGELPVGNATSPTVIVDEELYDQARAVIEDYEAGLKSGDNVAEVTDIEGQFDWPVCPDCDELREMTCPGCGYSGNEFVESHSEAVDELTAQMPLMDCLRCQHASPINLHPVCRFCKHDFSADQVDGIESGAAQGIGRIGVVMVGLLLTALAFAIWIIYAF